MDSAYLHAISPIDGRYRDKLKELSAYFSEASLFRYRLRVEVEYFIALCQQPIPQLTSVPKKSWESLRDLYLSFGEDSALKMKEIEKLPDEHLPR